MQPVCKIFEGEYGFQTDLYFIQDEECFSRGNGFSPDVTKFGQNPSGREVGLEDGLELRSFFKIEIGGIREAVSAKLLEYTGFTGSGDALEEEWFSVTVIFPILKFADDIAFHVTHLEFGFVYFYVHTKKYK